MSRPSPDCTWHGILNIDKPVGLTSHDVVSAVRRAADQRRVGHAGTLDPLADGVLLVCLGAACRVVTELQNMTKRYRATLRLGMTTTTFDAEGEVTAQADASGVSRQQFLTVLEGFRGTIWQTPPMYSALKRAGRPLYELARDGLEVARQARQVTVHDLELAVWNPPLVELRMTVSRGTYVRVLAHDIGQAMRVGAHLTQLTRTAIGPFQLGEAHALAEVEQAFREGWGSKLLHPIDAALTAYPVAVLSAKEVLQARCGQGLQLPNVEGDRLRAYDHAGALVAVLRRRADASLWFPERVFPISQPEVIR